MEKFFIGWHQPRNGPSGCGTFPYAMVNVNRLVARRSFFPVNDWILDSGAFTRISSGRGHLSVDDYCREILRWQGNGNMLAAVSQDFMCESFILEKTGLEVADHQVLTIARYDRTLATLKSCRPDHAYLMPVLQGFEPADYVNHLLAYGDRLRAGAWVGVGSVCKRNSKPSEIEAVLQAIATSRPDLKLHGFGLKRTALKSPTVWGLLHSADSMAPSYHARMNPQKGQSSNDPAIALAYALAIAPPSEPCPKP